MTLRLRLSLLLALLVLLAASGCGGGGSDNNDNNDTTRVAGVLDTNSSYDPDNDLYFDLYEFRARRSSPVTLDARSSHFDTILGVEDTDDSSVAYSDDNGGSGSNSRLDFDVENNRHYMVAVGSVDGSFGEYDLEVSHNLEYVSTRRVAKSLLPATLKQKMGALRQQRRAGSQKL